MASPTLTGSRSSTLHTSSKRNHDDSYAITDLSPNKRSKLSPPPLTPPESQPSTPTDADTAPPTPTRSNDGRPRIYICTKFPPCSQRFDRPCRLTEHERSHTGDRPFVCTVSPETCNKTFQRDYHLSRHVRHAHSDEATARPFVCTFELSLGSIDGSQFGNDDGTICGKAFATRQRLTLHERTHRDKPHCTEMVADGNGGFRRCAAVFRKEITLKAHVDKVHRGVKPFICGKELNKLGDGKRVCDAGYDTQGKLNEHIRRVHSGPRYVCGICMSGTSSESGIGANEDTIEGMNMEDERVPMAFETLVELAAHNRLIHPQPKERRPRGRPSSSKSTGDEVMRQKPKRRGNQHTQRLEYMESIPAADLLTGPINPSTQLAPMIDAMEISSNASIVDTEGWINCLNRNCEAIFPSEVALGEHCSYAHGMAEVEIAEALREREALKGGVFWVSGWREEENLNGLDWAMNSTVMIDPNLGDVNMTE